MDIKMAGRELMGKAIAYSIYSGKDIKRGDFHAFPGKHFLCYGTLDPYDLVEKFGTDKDIAMKMKDDMETVKPSFTDNLPLNNSDLAHVLDQELKKKSLPMMHVPLYWADGVPESIQEDVVFAGEYDSVLSCISSLRLGLNYYALQCSNEKLLSDEVSDQLKYADIEKECLNIHLVRNFIDPLRFYVESGDDPGIAKVRKEMLRFSKGCGFEIDFMNLFDHVLEEDDPEVSDAYLSKIEALSQERYESAAEMQKRIEELNSGRG